MRGIRRRHPKKAKIMTLLFFLLLAMKKSLAAPGFVPRVPAAGGSQLWG
jgi:hypothetical protein